MRVKIVFFGGGGRDKQSFKTRDNLKIKVQKIFKICTNAKWMK